MGYVERLENGNTLVSLGAGKPDILEVAPDGSKAMEMSLPPGIYTYRAFRLPRPVLALPRRGPPGVVRLDAIAPNPLRDRARLTLELASPAKVSVAIHDVAGREVRRVLDGTWLEPGAHAVSLDMSQCASGLYVCRVRAGGHSESRKLFVIR
jgi:hypothetical protein